MASLSQTQVDQVFDVILQQGVTYGSLQVDLLDHLCCMVESNMDDGSDFQVSLQHSLHEFGLNNLSETQEATLYLLTLKTRRMKKAISLIAIVAALFVLLGIAFKINHFMGANVLFVLGVVLCAAVVLPAMAAFELKNTENGIKRGAIISGYAAGVLLSLATMFKFMHWPGVNVMYYLGLGILVVIFIPMYTLKNYRTAENKLFAIAKSMLIIAGISIIWASYRMIDMSLAAVAIQ